MPHQAWAARGGEGDRGHYAYCGIADNSYSLRWFRDEVGRVWREWLVRPLRRAQWTVAFREAGGLEWPLKIERSNSDARPA